MKAIFAIFICTIFFTACSSKIKSEEDFEQNPDKLIKQIQLCKQNQKANKSLCKKAYKALKNLRKKKFEYFIKRENEANAFIKTCKQAKPFGVKKMISCVGAKRAINKLFKDYVVSNYLGFKNSDLLTLRSSLDCEEKLENKIGKEPLNKNELKAWLAKKNAFLKSLEPKIRANCENAFKALQILVIRRYKQNNEYRKNEPY